MFKELTKIGPPLHPPEEVFDHINSIKSGNEDMNMGKITIKAYHIGMPVEFESPVMHLSNFLPKAIPTRGILFVVTDLEVKVKNQERHITSLSQN